MEKIFQNIIYMALGLFILTGCNDEKSTAHSDDESIQECHKKAAHDHEAMDSAEPSGSSLFHLSSAWTDQHGNEVTLESMKGSPTVVSMVYTSCQYACPRIVSDMIKIEENMDREQRDHTKFVLVSFDSENDTPEKLKAYAKKLELDPDRWVLLNGSDMNIMELAMVLGIKYKKSGEMDFSHSNIISLLNPQGEIVFQQEGLGNPPDEALTALNKLKL